MKRRPPVVIIRKRSDATTSDEGRRTSRRSSRRGARDGASSKTGDGQTSERGSNEESSSKAAGSGALRKGNRSDRRTARTGGPSASRRSEASEGQPRKQPQKDSEKLARRKAATELAESAGIPIAYAHRILQGQTTLKDVTQKLMRKAKLEALVRDEDLDPSLAGQVAAGKLKLERARVINKMRRLRPHSVSKDGFHLAEEIDGSVGVQCFGNDWLIGKVSKSEIYEVDFQAEESGEVHRLVKHDVKMIVLDGTGVLDELVGIDQEVAAQGLEGTGEVTQRIKVPEKYLIEMVESEGTLRLVCRDGATVKGQVVCFSRWDIELRVTPLTGGDPVSVIVFNHALHPKSAAIQA